MTTRHALNEKSVSELNLNLLGYERCFMKWILHRCFFFQLFFLCGGKGKEILSSGSRVASSTWTNTQNRFDTDNGNRNKRQDTIFVKTISYLYFAIQNGQCLCTSFFLDRNIQILRDKQRQCWPHFLNEGTY